MRGLRWVLGAACAVAWAGLATAAGPDQTGRVRPRATDEARELARTIDRLLAQRWAEAKVPPVEPADDAEYLRRVYLDLIGKIPAAADARDFLDDPDPEKRSKLVDRLLDSPAYLARATELWRQMLLPEADTDDQARLVTPPFEAWLRRKVAEGTGYDEIVREILTARLGGRDGNPLNSRAAPSPAAFYLAKQGKPENLAAGTARVFLGIRLECAQCHDHPFAAWKREQFWQFAAFFAGVQRQGPEDGYGAVREIPNRRELAISGTDRIVKAKHLDGHEPQWGGRVGGRELLARWVTSGDNPYFARAVANRVWARFFGTGIVEPVDDLGDENPPSHPELLDELARQFVAHDYDLKFLIRAITATQAYGLTSAVRREGTMPPELFAAMPVRALSPGQLYASLVQATGIRDGGRGSMMAVNDARGRFFELFANRDEKPTEGQTSILQALTLMNGPLVSNATSLEMGDTLAAIADAPYMTTAERIEALYLAALTRRPRPEETALLVEYVEGGGPAGDPGKALADVLWALLNGPEFKHNH